MKTFILILLTAMMSLSIGCGKKKGGGSSSPAPAACTPTYDAQGRIINACNGVNPYGANPYGSPYGGTPYGGQTPYGGAYGGSNPCDVYRMQFGIPYYPAMVGGQWMCVRGM